MNREHRLQEVFRRARSEKKGTWLVVDEIARKRFQTQGFHNVLTPMAI